MLDPLLPQRGAEQGWAGEDTNRRGERTPLATAFLWFSHSEQVHCVILRLPRPLLTLEDGCTGEIFFFFVNLTQARVIWEGGTSVEKTPPSDWSVSKTVGYFPDQ